MNTFAITINSAISTLEICDRQARKDCGKIARFTYNTYTVLSSAEAKAHYRYAWKKFMQLAEIIGLVAIALCNDLDRWISEHERVQAVEPMQDEVMAEPIEQPIDRTAEPVKIQQPHPAELTDRELIQLAKQKRVQQALKMALNRKLSSNARQRLIDAIA